MEDEGGGEGRFLAAGHLVEAASHVLALLLCHLLGASSILNGITSDVDLSNRTKHLISSNMIAENTLGQKQMVATGRLPSMTERDTFNTCMAYKVDVQ